MNSRTEPFVFESYFLITFHEAVAGYDAADRVNDQTRDGSSTPPVAGPRSALGNPRRKHKHLRTIDAIVAIYSEIGNLDDLVSVRLNKINEYHKKHGYPLVSKSAVYRARLEVIERKLLKPK